MLTETETAKLNEDAAERTKMNLRVLVVGGGFLYCQMFYQAGFLGARNVEDADIICFTGGEDVDPSLYGEKPLPETFCNPDRDAAESIIYSEAVLLKKPMVGICRGSQFLTVMNGGKLWQDVNNHTRRHPVVDTRSGEVHQNMTSTHHQMMRPGPSGEVLAVASQATSKRAEKETRETNDPVENSDVEAVWYADSRSLAFQPHPEFGHGECRNYFLELVDEFVVPAC